MHPGFHKSGKPGKVREFENGHGKRRKVREFVFKSGKI